MSIGCSNPIPNCSKSFLSLWMNSISPERMPVCRQADHNLVLVQSVGVQIVGSVVDVQVGEDASVHLLTRKQRCIEAREWGARRIQIVIVCHHIHKVHVLVDHVDVVEGVLVLGRSRHRNCEQVRTPLSLILPPDLVQQLAKVLTVFVVGRGKLPVQVHAVHGELLQVVLERLDELLACLVVAHHVRESVVKGTTAHPEENLQLAVLLRQLPNLRREV